MKRVLIDWEGIGEVEGKLYQGAQEWLEYKPCSNIGILLKQTKCVLFIYPLFLSTEINAVTHLSMIEHDEAQAPSEG